MFDTIMQGQKIPVLPVLVGRKSRSGKKVYIFKLLFHDIQCDITEQLIKNTDTLNSIHEN